MPDPQLIDRLTKKLLDLKSELAGLASAQGSKEDADNIALDQSRVGRLSRMDALAGAAMSAETNRRRKLQLKMINEALQRVDAGSYGECQECLEDINPERLEFNPAAALCIQCATLAENSAES